MNLAKKFLLTALSLGSIATFANPNKEKIQALNDKINATHKESQDLRQQSELKKREVNKLKFERRYLEKESQVNKLLAGLDTVKPKKARKILLYSRTNGFRHSSIETGVGMLKIVGEKTGAFQAIASEDVNIMNDDDLAQFDAIVMVNTTGNNINNPKARAAFEKFLASEKGLVGIHAATDCHKDWDNYLEAMGGIFDGHPWGAGSHVTLHNEAPDHVCSKMVPEGFVIRDEIYQYKDDKHFTRDKMRVLLSLDLDGKDMKKGGMKRKDNDYPVSWLRNFTGSRIFYTNLGHNEDTFFNPVAMQHMLTGIQYAMGDIDADSTPSAELGIYSKQYKK